MPRVRKGAARAQARKRILRKARGYFGSNHKSKYRAEYAVVRAGVYAYRDRRRVKRDYRRLWTARITAACRMRGTRYSLFMHGLKHSGVLLNRKMLSEIAIHDPALFDVIVKDALRSKNVAVKEVGARTAARVAAPSRRVTGAGVSASAAALGTAAVASFAGGSAKAAKPAAKSGGKGDIIEIEGIGPTYAAKLKKAKIEWIRELRERGRTKAGRAEIAEQSGIDEKLILDWVNMADLLRVEGMTPDFAELLLAAGVDTVKELATRVPANLHQALVEANSGAKKISVQVPGEDLVEKFVAKAKTMPAGVEH